VSNADKDIILGLLWGIGFIVVMAALIRAGMWLF